MPEQTDAGAAAAVSDDRARADLLDEIDRVRVQAAAAPDLERRVRALHGELAAIEGSFSWRITAPLRHARWAVDHRRDLALAAGRRLKRRLER